MNDAQIKHMVDRFLMWRLPKPWNPDNGISYARPNYAHPPADHDWPTGTNLFDATQAEVMVRHMVEGLRLAESHATLTAALEEARGVLVASRSFVELVYEETDREEAADAKIVMGQTDAALATIDAALGRVEG